MSDTAEQKIGLTAWQRWELPAFDAPEIVLPDTLPTAEQLEKIQQQAHEDGYQSGHQEGSEAGYKEGREKGYQEGYQEGQKLAAEETKRLSDMVTSLNVELQNIDSGIAEDMMKLSLAIAKQVLLQSLKVKPELLLPIVQQAISALPQFNQHASLTLHPDDAKLLREQMGEQLAQSGWKIYDDAQIERGGCRIETANSQIDASAATRWQRVVASIGRSETWLEK